MKYFEVTKDNVTEDKIWNGKVRQAEYGVGLRKSEYEGTQ